MLTQKNSGVANILHPHKNTNALNAKTKTAPWPPGAPNRAGPWAGAPLGLEPPRYCMSLWEFWWSQSCIILRTPELFCAHIWTLEVTMWLDVGGSLELPNDT